MKKTAIILACLLLAGVCTGCGKDAGGNSQGSTQESNVTSSADAAPADGSSSAAEAQETGASAGESAADGSAAADSAVTEAASGSAQTAAPDAQTSAENGSSAAQTQAAAAEASVGSDLTIGIPAKVTAKAGAKEVPVTVKLWNNPTYSGMGVRLYYDGALKPKTGDGDTCEHLPGEAADGMLTTCLVDVNQHLIGFAVMALKRASANGDLFTVYFDVPADAKPGTEYPLTLEIVDFADADKAPLQPKALSSAIVVE